MRASKVSEDEGETEPRSVDPHMRRLRIKYISKWLCVVIGYDPNIAEMDGYAEKFLDLGLTSVDQIKAECTTQEILEFDWMKSKHRIKFLTHYTKGIKEIREVETYLLQLQEISGWLCLVCGYHPNTFI